MAIINENDRVSDAKSVDKALSEVEKTLRELDDSISENIDHNIDELTQNIDILKKSKSLDVQAQRIDSNELSDPNVSTKGDIRGRVFKKVYGVNNVACKPAIDHLIKDTERDLLVLGKLNQSQYILDFYGLSKINGVEHTIFEWCEYGTLKEVYNKFDIPWIRKLQFIRDICCGIVFLRRANIFHHDIRCENVTQTLSSKLGNFRLPKVMEANLIDNIQWMAPEQIKNRTDKNLTNNTYTSKCEIFSFGMLIWELCYEKIPYESLQMKDIAEHILSGKREKLLIGNLNNPVDEQIQKEFIEIIDEAWRHNPDQRIDLSNLHRKLETLAASNPITPSSGQLGNKTKKEFKEKPETIDFLMPIEKGIECHQKREYDKAWKCFEENSALGDLLAKYWQAYYLLNGYGVKENKERAKQLFKEAADNDHTNAQLQYALLLLQDIVKEKSDSKKGIMSDEIIHYLRLSADNKNTDAMFYLGEIYYNGNHETQKNEELGLKYLNLAANNGNDKAIKLLVNMKKNFS
ncbi:7731_t:CDS:2 [Dentiscutata heterogama]|uniref:7731_t:CDS:1 n=1 Tax=Dentiscutata heterogama TaxID=1316150 RepID=A0ACA9KX32_9GLOM|nr:7731_t:CDS:2 [Dentiscutata heterogama]